jgi:hypothetical protein
MAEVRTISFEDGQQVLIEVYDAEIPGDVERVGIGDKAKKTFEAAWNAVQPAIKALARKLTELGPTDAQIKFGVKVSAELDAIIASTKGEANFEITLAWKGQK